MTLQLSGQRERMVDPHREFYGQVVKQMPLLVSGRDEKSNIVDVPRIPASFGYVLERRETAPKDVRGEWQTNYIFTGDAVATSTLGDVVSTWDSSLLRSLTPQSKLANGALVLSTLQMDELKAQKEGMLYLSADEVGEGHEKGYRCIDRVWTPENKTVGKVWDHLSRGRNLHTYAQLVNDTTHSDVVMRVYFDRLKKESPSLRSWVADRIDYDSSAYGVDFLYIDYGRLVGVAPEAHVARQKLLEARV